MTEAPPRPPFALRLGVTGHRSGSLGTAASKVAERIEQAVAEVTAAANAEYSANRQDFADLPPDFWIVSALADGADQMAAAAAIDQGYALHAILPFQQAQYRASIAEPFRGEFDRLAGQAAKLVELRGSPAQPLPAYVAAGRATVMLADLLLALWDGEAPRGRGGTGEVVELAVRRGVPVIHVPVDPARPLSLIAGADGDCRPFERRHLVELIRRALANPAERRPSAAR